MLFRSGRMNSCMMGESSSLILLERNEKSSFVSARCFIASGISPRILLADFSSYGMPGMGFGNKARYASHAARQIMEAAIAALCSVKAMLRSNCQEMRVLAESEQSLHTTSKYLSESKDSSQADRHMKVKNRQQVRSQPLHVSKGYTRSFRI